MIERNTKMTTAQDSIQEDEDYQNQEDDNVLRQDYTSSIVSEMEEDEPKLVDRATMTKTFNPLLIEKM